MSDDSWIQEDRDHLYRMEQERTQQVRAKVEARKEIVGYIAVAVGIMVVIGMLLAAIWTGIQRSNETKAKQIADCVQAGGTMFDLTNSGPTCLHLRGES